MPRTLAHRWFLALVPVLLGAALALPSSSLAQRRIVPEFPPGTWLNTDRPLSLRGLRGKIVLLDFWTYGCINCMHALPELKKLERKYPNELVIVSVHTAKFTNEDETGNIRNAVLRYNIEHPIYNDAGRVYWTRLGIGIWPTFVLIDPEGYHLGSVTGEGRFAELDRAIGRAVAAGRASGKLNSTPLKLTLEAAKAPATPLWYPGKILADTEPGGSGRLFIADSNHNRIIIARPTGEVEAVAGSGEAGLEDGPFDTARFSSPQGMALRRGADGSLSLLVADTNNHAIRSLDLARGRVTTLAGTGKQANVSRLVPGGSALKTRLASPWDLLLDRNKLYIAMAGPHQIWVMDLEKNTVFPYAGSGKEARADGALRAAAFAQPSGLATDGKRLFVADSEISAIRAVDLPAAGASVRTLAGGDLFDFGDRDGPGLSARLQHPLGVAYRDGSVYIADTYNHKLKRLDLKTGVVETFLGGGRGSRDGTQPQFYEPGGISISGNRLYVADTNNHRIRVVDLTTRSTSTLALKNLPPPLPADPERPIRPAAAKDDTVTAPLVRLAPGSTGQLTLDLRLPAGQKLGPDSPHRFQATVEGEGVKLAESAVPAARYRLPLTVPLTTSASGKGAVLVTTTVFYCSEADKTCSMKALKFRLPYEISAGGGTTLTAAAKL